MVFFLINLKKKITITLVMLHLKMVEVVEVVLEDLVVLMDQISQIYSKIFLEILEEEEEIIEETLTIEAQT